MTNKRGKCNNDRCKCNNDRGNNNSKCNNKSRYDNKSKCDNDSSECESGRRGFGFWFPRRVGLGL